MSRVSSVSKVLISEIDYLFAQNQQLVAQNAQLQLQLQTTQAALHAAQTAGQDTQEAEDAMTAEIQKLGLTIPGEDSSQPTTGTPMPIDVSTAPGASTTSIDTLSSKETEILKRFPTMASKYPGFRPFALISGSCPESVCHEWRNHI